MYESSLHDKKYLNSKISLSLSLCYNYNCYFPPSLNLLQAQNLSNTWWIRGELKKQKENFGNGLVFCFRWEWMMNLCTPVCWLHEKLLANTSHGHLGTLYLRTNRLYSFRESAMMHRNFRVQKLLFILE